MVHQAGAGPEPIPHRELTAESLRAAIDFVLSPGAKRAAVRLAEQICNEVRASPLPSLSLTAGIARLRCLQDGLKAGVESFYKHLPLLNMRYVLCNIT
jgi:sterol 3beta-glucosyltransferase